jgi:hypothetical protein
MSVEMVVDSRESTVPKGWILLDTALMGKSLIASLIFVDY